jgi:two-component system cell cycle response regulator
MKVLIVEDSKVFLEIFTGIFSKIGYVVSTASNVKEATEILKVGDFVAVCFGYELKGGNGCELAKYCRMKKIIRDETPIFLITSQEFNNTLFNEALRSGITDVIARTDVEKVYQQIEKYAQNLLYQRSEHGRILYIEDDRAVAQATMSVLSKISTETTHITRADNALSHLESKEYSLLLSDIVVEGEMSVLSLVRQIRALKSNLSTIPIMLVTGFDDLARRIEFYREGVNDYLIKPTHEYELLVRVKNLVVNYQLTRKAQEQTSKVNWLSNHDVLTGCYNRNALSMNFSQVKKEAIIKEKKVGLMLLDIDRFKWINENIGIAAADNILAEIGKILMNNLRANEYVYRMGDDDFLIITCVTQDSKKLIERANTISNLISKADYEKTKVTVTVGATIQDPKELGGAEEILIALGNQLEQSRVKQGYNSINYFDQIDVRW